MTDFSERLKQLRDAHGISQQDLAEYLKLNKQTISGYERGVRRPAGEGARDLYEKLADYFNVDVSYLMGLSDVSIKISDPCDNSVIPSDLSLKYSKLTAAGKEVVNTAIETEYKKEQEKLERFKKALLLDKITTIEQAKDILGDVAAYGGYASEKMLINMANKVLQENKKKR